MRVEIVPATPRDACYIAANMRPADRAELGCVISLEHPSDVACLLIESAGDLAFVAKVRGQPVAIFGVSPMLPHVYSGWAFGTNDMRRAVPAMTRHCLGVIAPALRERGVIRLEVRTMAAHDLSHGWLSGMGARRETEPYAYGRHGERFVTYGWS